MKKIKQLVSLACILLPTIASAQGAAPSMHLNSYFSGDAILKMQKIRIDQSAAASFFEVSNFNGGYCGLQQVTTAATGSTNTLISSLWDTNTAKGIYSRMEYADPTTVVSRFGGEGDGTKTMNPYAWEKSVWYNIVNRSWKANGRYYVATFIQNLSSGKWFHTSTTSKPFAGSYLGNYNDSFMENWTSNGAPIRKAFFKDCFFMNTSGTWGKGTGTTFSANSGDADRNGIYDLCFNAYYDATEDAFCMQHGGNTVRDAAFNGGRSRTLGNQFNQTNQPVLTVGAITELTATNNAGVTTVNWKIDDTKSPQLSAKIEILNSSNAIVLTLQDTIPNKRTFNTKLVLAPGDYVARLTVKDIFNQSCPVVTANFSVANAKYLSVSKNEFAAPVEANSANKFDILSNADWTISSDKDWLITTKTSGSANATITITATDNSSNATERVGHLTVASDGLVSQVITVTQKIVETWYYVLNQRGWTTGAAPKLTNALTGTALGVQLTANAPLASDYSQQWKIVKNGTTDVLLINRKTGLAIDGECKASNPASLYYWRLQSYSGSTAYPGYRIISKSTSPTIGIHAQGSSVFDYNTEAAECFWVFKTPEELYANNQPITPIEKSYDLKTVWYTIHTPGRTTNNYLTDKGVGAEITGTNFTANNDAQMWKIVDMSDGTVNIISKLNNGQIKVPNVHLANISLTTSDQSWSLVYQGSEQYHIVNTEYQLNMSTANKLIASNGTTLGDASCWIFEKVLLTGTDLKKPTDTSIKIYAVKGMVQVIGTDQKPTVYHISGQEVDATKVLSRGIYIVKVANQIGKVIIN
ncbi:MAG: hypothetical protein H6Q18_657 [Bacteroidetes bacterium]|nr:hypothetical protein [Bacteroidota bacterium]